MNAHELYRAGRLQDAIAAMNDEVRKNPADIDRRAFLAELLATAGNLDRADLQLDALSQIDSKAAVGIATFRHLVRAAQARMQCFTEGRVPEFLGQPTSAMRGTLEALIHLREGRPEQARAVVEQAEASRVHPRGTCDGKPFDDLRDLDDVCAGVFEVLTSNGKYYWVPIESVALLEFRAVARPRDLLWRRVHMVVREGPDGEVFIPCTYPGRAEDSESLRLGRATEWVEPDGGPIRGRGLRTWLVGEDEKTVLDVQAVEFKSGS
jgi:type VI secretion system protein ImpE